MRSTIFNFRMNLEDANYLYLISDSIFPIISFNYQNKLIVDRKDYSIKSQIRLLSDSGVPQYNDIYEYCGDDENCLVQTLFYGYFGHIAMVSFDIESGDGYKPEFLLDDSEYIDILKVKGYEFYGFVSNKNKFLIRGFNSGGVLDISGYRVPLYKYGNMPQVDSMLYPGGYSMTYLRYPIDYSGIGGDRGLTQIVDFPRYPIITADMTPSVSVWAEKNNSFNDEVVSFIDISIATSFGIFSDGLFNFYTVTFFSEEREELAGFVSNFGIILYPKINMSIFYGNDSYFELTI